MVRIVTEELEHLLFVVSSISDLAIKQNKLWSVTVHVGQIRWYLLVEMGGYLPKAAKWTICC